MVKEPRGLLGTEGNKMIEDAPSSCIAIALIIADHSATQNYF